jgi:type I restriction enzyme, S subunit
MNASWPAKDLGSIAEIRVSNVDKKTHAGEKPVKLCNYLDVYSNEYVTSRLDFMEASASLGEIERFALQRGDVVITKDSETPDDIGIPAVIADSIGGLVCGYHLALIRPRAGELDSVYLAKQLSTSRVARYFALHASGSTRYGLPISAIESVSIPTPPKPEQTKIAEVLSTVDRVIEQTEALISKQQRINAGLMRDLLTRGIDEQGNLRSERTHSFKDSPFGRIPAAWEVETLGSVIGPIVSGWSPTCEAVPASGGEWAILKTTAVVWQGYTPTENKRLPSGLAGVPSIEVHANDILITRKGPVERVGVVVHVKETRSMLMIPDTVFRMRVLDGSEIIPAFLPHALGSVAVQSDWFQKKIGLADAQVNLNHSILRTTVFPKPSHKEQQLIVARAENMSQQTYGDLRILRKLRSLKTALMQDLLTGRKRVTPLLEQEAPLNKRVS